MTRTLSMALFFSVALAIVGLSHYYIWARVVRDPALPRAWFRVLTAAVVMLALSIPATFWASHVVPPGAARGPLLVAYSWLGLLMFFIVLLLGVELLRFVAGLITWGNDAPTDPERRLTLTRMLSGAVALGVTGLGGASVMGGLREIAVKRVDVPLPRLARALDGFRVVQLSDLHIGPTLAPDFVDRIVERVNALEPDLVVITGDLVDGSVDHLGGYVERLRHLRSGHGTFFVTGNHEYYAGAEEWVTFLRQMGIRVLDNERVSIETGENAFDLAGVHDYAGSQLDARFAPDFEKALGGRDPNREVILLAHQPKAVFDAERYGVGLILSGHTHGGQIWPWNHLVPLQQPVVAGLARLGQTFVYVSSGTGYWGPPMRLGTNAEITHIVLRAESRLEVASAQ